MVFLLTISQRYRKVVTKRFKTGFDKHKYKNHNIH